MAVKTINLADLASNIEDLSKKEIEALKKSVVSGVARSIPYLVEQSPVDTGLYAQSWDFTADEQKVILGNFAPHAAIIEHGARPFKPPLQPLLAWAKRVLQDPSQPPNYSDRVWGLAIYTQRKIEAVGIYPKNILQNSLPQIIEFIKLDFIKEAEKL